MKKLFIILSAVIFLASGCKKEEMAPEPYFDITLDIKQGANMPSSGVNSIVIETNYNSYVEIYQMINMNTHYPSLLDFSYIKPGKTKICTDKTSYKIYGLHVMYYWEKSKSDTNTTGKYNYFVDHYPIETAKKFYFIRQ
jgi:hypothetical protein